MRSLLDTEEGTASQSGPVKLNSDGSLSDYALTPSGWGGGLLGSKELPSHLETP